MTRKTKLLRTSLLVLAAGFVAIQFVPVARTNPPAGGTLQAPAEVMAVLKRSCWDCHSNETEWPWYSRIAPVSWLVAHDVDEGREHLNFSTWGQLDRARQAKLLEEAMEEIDENKMPLGIYTWLHGDAGLGPGDIALLRSWAASEAAPGTSSR